jgi:hypothetical protein
VQDGKEKGDTQGFLRKEALAGAAGEMVASVEGEEL